MTCPRCKKGDVARSARRGLVEGFLLRLIFLTPVRCLTCQRRFLVFSMRAPASPGRRSKSLARFLGLQGQESAIRTRAVALLAGLVLFALALALAFSLIEH